MSAKYPDKIVIGLTGNIAAGKSIVRRMLEHLGAFGIDADGLVHKAMSPGAPAFQPVVDYFGKRVLGDGGEIDRAKLARIVFADAEELAKLEEITHPIVRQVVGLLIRRATQKVVVIEAIKLFEGKLAEDCDAVWVVDATEDVRLLRLVNQRKMQESEAKARMAAQGPQEEKKKKAALVIENSGSYEKTFEAVQQAYNKLLGIKEEPAAATPAPAAAPAAAATPAKPAAIAADSPITIQRSNPKNAEAVAAFVNSLVGTKLTRTDVMMRSYMLAYVGDTLVGAANWMVENLITRITEFLLAPNAPTDNTTRSLLESIEKASSALQSELSLLFLTPKLAESVERIALNHGYERREIAELKVPDWREAAVESAPPDTVLFAKKSPGGRVLKPL